MTTRACTLAGDAASVTVMTQRGVQESDQWQDGGLGRDEYVLCYLDTRRVGAPAALPRLLD